MNEQKNEDFVDSFAPAGWDEIDSDDDYDDFDDMIADFGYDQFDAYDGE